VCPPESPTSRPENQEGRRKRIARRPRTRLCLLKGCEQRFHPSQPRQRYCSERCREAARKWSRRKAQERYRETAAGQQNRNRQSRRYRERIKSRKPREPEAVNDPARVITIEHFFSIIAATGQDATRDSFARGEVPCSASARPPAGAPLSGSKTGSGDGNRRAI
jgi:hypothetical protein